MTDRYTDKPFLRFVDAYVLKAIGHLDAATETYCKAMVPQLEQSFGLNGQLGTDRRTADEIRTRTARADPENLDRRQGALCRGQWTAPDPVQFAYLFVDRNLQRA